MSLSSIAVSHIGEPGGLNTCISNGIQRWAKEAGLPQIGNNTASRGVYVAAAKKAGVYHTGMQGVQVNDILDWALPYRHMSVVDHIDANGNIRSVGSGNMTSVPPIVDYQPKGGGHMSPSMFIGYVRLSGASNGDSPTATPAVSLNPLETINNTVTDFQNWWSGALGDPKFWYRVGLFSLGTTLLVIAVIALIAHSSAVQGAVSDTKKVVKTGTAIAAKVALKKP